MDGQSILNRIEDNDPNLVDFAIGRYAARDFPPGWDWEKLGNAIGQNTSLKKLSLDIIWMADEELMALFGPLSTNTTLRELIITPDCIYLSKEALSSLVPLFKNSKDIERLKIICESPCLPLLAAALTEMNSLQAFHLRVSNRDRTGAVQAVHPGHDIIKALSRHRGLKELNVSIGRGDCALLQDILQSQDSKLAVLHLGTPWQLGGDPGSTLTNADASIFAKGLAGSNTLRDLSLAYFHNLPDEAWRNIFLAFKSPSSRLEKLSLFASNAASVAGIHLFGALENNRTLKVLDLRGNQNITMASSLALSKYLQSTSQLEEIDLEDCHMNNESMVHFSNSLAKNISVKKLRLRTIKKNSPEGWAAFSRALQSPVSALERLDMSNNCIDDERIGILFNAIFANNKLKELRICDTYNNNIEGWRNSVPVLLNLNSSLEILDFQENNIDNDTLISFIPYLADNVTLKVFLADSSDFPDDDFVPLGTDSWTAYLSLLCNESSIMDTYQSNHTLKRLFTINVWNDPVVDKIESLLNINRHNSKSQAARLKIFQTHFGGGFIAPPFNGMDIKLLPQALAWMSRAVGTNEVDGHFYMFVKDFLFQ